MPTCQLAESEVISPISRVTHLSSGLPMTACDRFTWVNSTYSTHAARKLAKVSVCRPTYTHRCYPPHSRGDIPAFTRSQLKPVLSLATRERFKMHGGVDHRNRRNSTIACIARAVTRPRFEQQHQQRRRPHASLAWLFRNITHRSPLVPSKAAGNCSSKYVR